MRDIFTYPDNSATYYIDPRYIGDNTAGFQKRINDMRNNAIGGAYNFVHQPDASLEAIMAGLGRYYNMYNNIDTNNTTVYNFTKRPMVELVTREKSYEINSVHVDEAPGPVTRMVVTVDNNAEISNGEDFKIYQFAITSGFNQRNWTAFTDATAGSFTNSTDIDLGTYGELRARLGGSNIQIMRYGDGALMLSDTSFNFADHGSVNYIYKNGPFSEPQTGTVDTTGGIYAEWRSNPELTESYSALLYTDSSLTTPATITEQYHTNLTLSYSGDGTYVMTDIDVAAIDPAVDAILSANQKGWCRITFTNQTGTFTGQDQCDKEILGAVDYTVDFYWFYNQITDLVSFYSSRQINPANQIPADFIIGGGGSVDIVVDFIKTATLDTDVEYNLYYDGTETVSGSIIATENWDTANNRPYHEIDVAASDILLYGNWNWANLDVSGNPVYQAKFTDYIMFPGEQYFVNYSTTIDDSALPVDIDLIVDGSGFLTDWTINETGRISTASTLRWSWLVGRYADEYVPSPPTNLQLAQAEDYFDTNDEWNTYTGFAQKYWPAIPPKSARIDMKTPTLTTFSQSGMKYARHAGYTRWGMDVEYPPLTKDQLAELQAAALLARGGAVTFYFRIDPLSTGAAFGFLRNFKSNVVPRIKTYDSVNQVLLVEGFQSDEAEVIVEGQLMNSSGLERNGAVQLALNSTDANVFGEAKIKLGFNDYQYPPAVGNSVWLTPNTIIVSLSEDNFQYVERGDGLYNVSVKFDLDTWK